MSKRVATGDRQIVEDRNESAGFSDGTECVA
jgi:hypothetical protein